MSKCVPEKYILLRSLITFFQVQVKKTAAEGYQMLVEAYEHDLIQRACGRWFKCFKNCEFDVKDT